ncbi:hypothetical protein V6N13_126607 [Hibiscus sabdariffa]|uniref:Uncharacterized protein n=1 Tax=Hibiscus sabdariffa TaxID=183260 RepID=A0ABR2REZ8_9ROSI
MKSVELKAYVVRDLVLLACIGLRPVLIHDGDPEINTLLNQFNIASQFRDGLRVTNVRIYSSNATSASPFFSSTWSNFFAFALAPLCTQSISSQFSP